MHHNRCNRRMGVIPLLVEKAQGSVATVVGQSMRNNDLILLLKMVYLVYQLCPNNRIALLEGLPYPSPDLIP